MIREPIVTSERPFPEIRLRQNSIMFSELFNCLITSLVSSFAVYLCFQVRAKNSAGSGPWLGKRISLKGNKDENSKDGAKKFGEIKNRFISSSNEKGCFIITL